MGRPAACNNCCGPVPQPSSSRPSSEESFISTLAGGCTNCKDSIAPFAYTFKWVYRSGALLPDFRFPCCEHGTIGTDGIPNEWILKPGWLMNSGYCHWVSDEKTHMTIWAGTGPPTAWSYSCIESLRPIPGAPGWYKPFIDLRVRYLGGLSDRTVVDVDIQHYTRQTYNGLTQYNGGFRFQGQSIIVGRLNCMEQFSVPIKLTQASGSGPFPAFCSLMKDSFDNYCTITPKVTLP